jgi:hypothetical protein
MSLAQALMAIAMLFVAHDQYSFMLDDLVDCLMLISVLYMQHVAA